MVGWVLVRRQQNKKSGPSGWTLSPKRKAPAVMAMGARQQQHPPCPTSIHRSMRRHPPYGHGDATHRTGYTRFAGRHLVRVDQPHTTPPGQPVVTICMTIAPNTDRHSSTNEACPPYMGGGHPTFQAQTFCRMSSVLGFRSYVFLSSAFGLRS